MSLTTVQPGMLGTPQPYNFKNRIINGAMVIDQRNAGASVATNGTNVVSLDRWKMGYSQNNKFTIQQNAGSVTTPVGFVNYLGVSSSSAYTAGSAEAFSIYQVIEGYNIADLGWGTASAKTVTLSFQVYSSLTGTFGGCLQNYAQTRSYPFSYTIPVANTWTTISITIAGDTTGTWLTNNSGGIIMQFGIGVGSTLSGTAGSWAGTNYISATGATSVVGTNGATFYITGVQLEVGVTATGFDYRPYGQELALCERYAQPITSFLGYAYSTTNMSVNAALRTTMRATPSVSATSALNFTISGVGNFSQSSAYVAINSGTTSGVYLDLQNYSGLTQFRTYLLNIASSGSVLCTAEL